MKIENLVLALFTVPTFAAQTESLTSLRTSFTDHAIFSNEKDPTTSTGQNNILRHEGKFSFDYGQTQGGIHFTNGVVVAGPQTSPGLLQLEKKHLEYRSPNWKLRIGDSSVELGRGIALALYEDQTFGIHNTVEGAKLDYTGESLQTLAFAGRLNALSVPTVLNPIESPLKTREVWVAGTGVYATTPFANRIGVHYFIAQQKEKGESDFSRRWHTAGAIYEKQGILGSVDLYTESNVLFSEMLGDLKVKLAPGVGSYGSLTWVPAPWKVKAEVKDYRNYHFAFRRAPTLEEDIIVSLNTEDISAGKISSEWRDVGLNLSVYGSYLLGDDRETRSNVHHGVIGARWKSPSRIEIESKFGYRLFPESHDLAHAQLKTKFPTFQGQSMEFGVRKQYARMELSDSSLDEDRNMVDFTYNFSEKFSTSLGYEYLPTNSDDVGKHFANVSLAYKSGAFMARSMAGSTSGGTQCSGGVCRPVPPYSGFMMESSYRF